MYAFFIKKLHCLTLTFYSLTKLILLMINIYVKLFTCTNKQNPTKWFVDLELDITRTTFKENIFKQSVKTFRSVEIWRKLLEILFGFFASQIVNIWNCHFRNLKCSFYKSKLIFRQPKCKYIYQAKPILC